MARANNIPEEMNHAGLGVRLQAFLWDYLLILLYIVLVGVVALLIPRVQNLFQSPVQSDFTAFVLLILPVLLYFALSEGGARGATWGKRKMGLQVVRASGDHLGVGRSLIRSIVKFLPWQFGHTAIYHSVFEEGMFSQQVLWILYALAYGLVGLYVLMIWRSSGHKALYDHVTDSAVIQQ